MGQKPSSSESEEKYSIHDLLAEQKKIVAKQKRKEWLAENWVSFFGLIFAAVAAIASVVNLFV